MNLRKYIVAVTVVAILIVIGWIFSASMGNEPDAEQEKTYQQANQFYQAEKYSEAINEYRKLLDQGIHTAAIHNNLASAYQRVGDMGKSILHYEKAIQLDHYDDEILSNLNRAREQIASYDNTEQTSWQRIASSLSTSHWVILASLALLILAVVMLLKLMGYIRLSVMQQTMIIIVVIGVMIFSIYAIKDQRNRSLGKGVVLVKNSSLRISPFLGADEVAVLQPGKLITIISNKTHEDYIQVKLDTGELGWLISSNIEPVKMSLNKKTTK